MKLSIVITTRNRKDDLLKCVNSVKESLLLHFDWELIIIDDDSHDGTEKYTLKNFGITSGAFIHNSHQKMMVKSRNQGILQATGAYILFIDDDNIIDKYMIHELVAFADGNKKCGILGPSMYYLKQNKKYLDFQKIGFFSGKTYGGIDNSQNNIHESDGVPNVFLVKKEVFDKTGLFDDSLIQTFTEPDFALNAKRYGYKCYILKKAKTYHNVNDNSLSIRTLGGHFSQKAYCLMRNRTVIIVRYGKWYHKLVYLFLFSWLWPTIYSLLMIGPKRFDLIRLYWMGFVDGLAYMLTGKLNNSLRQTL